MPENNNEPQRDGSEPVAQPIDGVLDLHHFRPGDVKSLVPEYLRECGLRGIRSVRIIHGKGSGVQRRIVHSILAKTPGVNSYRLAGAESGGWGATIVELEPE